LDPDVFSNRLLLHAAAASHKNEFASEQTASLDYPINNEVHQDCHHLVPCGQRRRW